MKEKDFEYDLATEFEDKHLKCPLNGGECDRDCAFLQKRNLVIDAAILKGYTLAGRKRLQPTTANVLTEYVCGYIRDADGYERVPSFMYYSPDYIVDGFLKKHSGLWEFNIVDEKIREYWEY